MNKHVPFLSCYEFLENIGRCIFLTLLFLLVSPQFVYPTVLTDNNEFPQKINNLRSLLSSINLVSKEMEEVQKILQGPQGIGREEALRSQILELSKKKKKDMESTFNQLSAGADFLGIPDRKENSNRLEPRD